jgi:hypothetical protein
MVSGAGRFIATEWQSERMTHRTAQPSACVHRLALSAYFRKNTFPIPIWVSLTAPLSSDGVLRTTGRLTKSSPIACRVTSATSRTKQGKH